MEFYNIVGNDLERSTTDTIALVSGENETQQRIVRRLLTPVFSYVWHPNYGCGLSEYVGSEITASDVRQLKGIILKQLFLEDRVARNPVPTVSININTSLMTIGITYKEVPSEKIFTFSFTVNE